MRGTHRPGHTAQPSYLCTQQQCVARIMYTMCVRRTMKKSRPGVHFAGMGMHCAMHCVRTGMLCAMRLVQPVQCTVYAQVCSVQCDWFNLCNALCTHRYALCNALYIHHACIRIYGVYTVILVGKSPYIRSYTVYIYGSGQP